MTIVNKVVGCKINWAIFSEIILNRSLLEFDSIKKFDRSML